MIQSQNPSVWPNLHIFLGLFHLSIKFNHPSFTSTSSMPFGIINQIESVIEATQIAPWSIKLCIVFNVSSLDNIHTIAYIGGYIGDANFFGIFCLLKF
jgi:hypothetical protein